MEYQAALDYLYSFLDSERRLPGGAAEFNLPRTAALLAALGNPQQRFPSLVVAGTKGKGSTAAMAEAMLRAGGRHVGLFTSPHLHTYRERIQVDRQLISRESFCTVIAVLRPAVATLDEALGQPTTFELGTAAALVFFATQEVDAAVLEVGLGGRYDSVNAVTPLVSVITSLSLDHTRTLGATLPEIAYQKAGIIKPAVPVVTAPQQPEALDVLARVAHEEAAPLFVATPAGLVEYASAQATPYPLDTTTVPLSMRGAVQRENARLALAALMLLGRQGLPTPPAALAHGLANTAWPGRLELAGARPLLLLDGAHNGDSAARLAQELREHFAFERLIIVLGISRDKDAQAILGELLPLADAVVLARSHHPRAFDDLEALAALARTHTARPVILGGDTAAALAIARTLAGPADLLCVTGSLFVVAEAREALGLPNEKD